MPQNTEQQVFQLDEHSKRQMAREYVELRKLADGKAMQREFRARLRKAQLPALRASKSAVRGLPSGKTKGTGLRRKIARTITAQVRLSGDPTMRIRIPRAPLGKSASLPWHMNKKGEWRHPLPNSEKWAVTVIPGSRNWFDNAMREQAPIVQVAVKQAMDEFQSKLAHP